MRRRFEFDAAAFAAPRPGETAEVDVVRPGPWGRSPNEPSADPVACPVPGCERADACEDPAHVPPAPPARVPAPRRLQLLSLSEIRSRPQVRWRVYRILTGFSMLWAGPGGFKTFLAVAWAVAVASGARWCGRAVHQGAVVYVVAEGNVRAFYNRVQAAAHALGVRDLDGLPIYVVEGGVNLSRFDAVQAQQLRAAILQKASDIGQPVGLLVVDTVSRCLPGDENTQEVMGAFVRTVDMLRADLGCDALAVHHGGATGERERGSTVLGGAVDCNLHLKRLGPPVNGSVPLGLYAVKLKDDESGGTEPIVRLESVRVTVCDDRGDPLRDEEGNEVTTCRLAEALAPPDEAPAPDLEGLALDWLRGHRGASGGKVSEGIRRNRKDVFSALRNLEGRGLIARQGSGWTVVGDAVTNR